MKTSLLAALALGAAAALPAMPAHAWAELNFFINGPQKPGHPVVLQCDANYAAACTGTGMPYSYTQGWNPLDGNRWSVYRLVMEGYAVRFMLYDSREACTVGSGYQRGWLWWMYANGPVGETLGPYRICTSRSMQDGKEYLQLKTQWTSWRNSYEINFLRGGPWPNPGVVFEFNAATKVLGAKVVP